MMEKFTAVLYNICDNIDKVTIGHGSVCSTSAQLYITTECQGLWLTDNINNGSKYTWLKQAEKTKIIYTVLNELEKHNFHHNWY